jgi:hypothetical protein
MKEGQDARYRARQGKTLYKGKVFIDLIGLSICCSIFACSMARILALELAAKVQCDGCHFAIDGALVVVEAALAELLDLGVLVVVRFAHERRCLRHVAGLASETWETHLSRSS